MREKTRQQQVHCTYWTGPQGVVQAAGHMHARMVELNENEKTVLWRMREAPFQ